MIGIIHLTPSPKDLIPTLIEGYKEEFVEIFEREDFKIDDAKEVIAQSYLTTDEEKLVILCANKFNHIAQNALLKIIEEPPEKVQFIIITKNKNALLPTIRSRMRLITHKQQVSYPPFELELSKLSLDSIYQFCKQNDSKPSSKEEVKQKIQSLLFDLHGQKIEQKIKLNAQDLARFDKAIMLNQNDATERENYIFLPLLLRLLLKQRGRL